ncbi:uncharacterized protein A1O9_03843 [Exophiala aquamarina CBS 119918]|uniref:Major facilitator superfamily (MFS) profile domain-containing protein n=1 Tax=Exophiala aquamarina CBS 119918 TaxID=1182545 RepID=A0A072PTX4_9EURO|nr:uncharacterized protein A1O9_03843 [Exophiala aquamarina CBS 119918]KEF59000.1 hypothetical protein A1O9_03843 [Exophiala aquamarina CBS 119918]
MSAAQNFGTALSLRILLGSAQSFVQGISLYSSLWYKRDEIATRGELNLFTALIYWAATFSGAFSGLRAYGAGENLTLDDTGKESWRWLFVIEGSIAMTAGVAIWVLLPKFTDSMKTKHWLFTPAEIEIARSRSASYNTTDFKIDFKQILMTLLESKSWGFAFMNAGIGYGISSVGYFLPTFIHELGFSPVRTQLFTVISYACTCTTLFIAIISDRLNKKGVFLIGTLSLSCIGYAMLLSNVSMARKIAAACIATTGLYPSIILLNAWLLSNTCGYTKRATAWALAEVFGPCFSILGSHVYDTSPRFIKGHAIALGLLLSGLITCCLSIFWMHSANKKKDNELREFEERGESHPHRTKSLEEVQDYHIDFRYILYLKRESVKLSVDVLAHTTFAKGKAFLSPQRG